MLRHFQGDEEQHAKTSAFFLLAASITIRTLPRGLDQPGGGRLIACRPWLSLVWKYEITGLVVWTWCLSGQKNVRRAGACGGGGSRL